MLRKDDKIPPFQTYTSPTPSQTRTNAAQKLSDCLVNGPARCSFTQSGAEGGTYPQVAPLGSIVQNCDGGNTAIKQSVTRSVTITDNWGVTTGVSTGYPLMGVARVSVEATISHSKEMSITQTLEADVPPGKKVVFAAYAKFKAIPGTMHLDYGNESKNVDIPAIYYQNTGGPAVTDAIMRNCDEALPTWNATIAEQVSAATASYTLSLVQGLGTLVLLAFMVLSLR
ncbi:hypothetical protein FS749_009085 [Ceratobasidium sp. UAMH 11750]|nr:hypothetical protein FS749_009085 [Ceratobasidium sp. UAMH 11750]